MASNAHRTVSAKSAERSESKTKTPNAAKSGAILLSAKDQMLFAETLLTPAPEVPDAIKKAAEHHQRLIIRR